MLHSILTTKPSKDYELLDSGREEKLERYGNIVLARPDPQALWEKHLGDEEWKRADAWTERKKREGVGKPGRNFQKNWNLELVRWILIIALIL
ncbi:MAG: hypothetical protein KBB46_03505, partial [Candidatus Pacebacteria bacterium]|nr:hypothetical protein [Candidatus Paceibacterota bacterium]